MVAEFFWPRGGWGRAALYVKHRMRRLPDTPEKIARGIFAGIFTVFSPFYGMHLVVAALIAFIVRGNVLAALLATFVGNPLTYIALFTDVDADWTALKVFYHDIFYPYMIGGIVPGIIFGLVAYYLSVPLIRAYQARRRGALKKKLAALRAKAEANKHDTGKQAADLADQDHGKGSQ